MDHRDKGEDAMQSLRGGWIRRTAVGATLTTLVLLAGLLASSSALAAPDPLAPSSTVVLQLRNFGGFKVKPKTLNLRITRGDLDPTTGAGTIETTGAFRVRGRGHKTKVKITALIFGANGGAGKINGKVGKRRTKGFGKLSGGSLTRDGFGAKLAGVSAKLGSKGAKALRRALSPGGGKKGGGKKASAAGGIKAGKPLGSVSVNAVPATVEVLPGGTLVFEAEVATFGAKLVAHCVNGSLGAGGVEPIAPGVQSGAAGEVFTFPVTGGSIAPDFSDGRVLSAGGQKLTKNIDADPPGPFNCSGDPPLGTSMTLTEWEMQFQLKGLGASVVVPAGPIGIGVQGDFDLGAATTSVDPNTKQITITEAPVLMDPLAANTINTVFPNGSGIASNDFMAGDLLGHVSLSVTTH
jgi:hypothetical protein